MNDFLAIGATQQTDLTSLLVKFRFFNFAFTADVEKMYKQILVNSQQLDLQSNESLRDSRLKTVTFGMSDAPYLAIRVLPELADRVKESHPIASSFISNCMYMDDVCWAVLILAGVSAENVKILSFLYSFFKVQCFRVYLVVC